MKAASVTFITVSLNWLSLMSWIVSEMSLNGDIFKFFKLKMKRKRRKLKKLYMGQCLNTLVTAVRHDGVRIIINVFLMNFPNRQNSLCDSI